MAGTAGKVHVVRVTKTGYVDRQGRRRDYSSAYLRRTYREGGKVKNETVANLSALPAHVIDLIDAGLKGTPLVPAGEAVRITRSVPHGHIAAAWAMAAKLGLPALLGPACAERDLALALVISRVVAPASKLSTLTWWADVTLGADLGVADACTDAVYAAMDWLAARQERIEARRAARHPAPGVNPSRMEALNTTSDGTPLEDENAYGWITALRAPAIKKLMADGGPLQMSLFDQQDLAEITSPDYPGERLVACRNPVLADDRARTRSELLAATDKLLAPIIARVAAGRLTGAGEIGVAVGKVVSKYNTGKHFVITITDDSLTVARNQAQIDDEAALDGFYVLRTPVPASQLDAPGVVTAYKNLKYVERDFRSIKADDLDLRPVFHRLEERVKAHVLICMLACYLTWHLRRAWAPLTFTDEHPPTAADPVAPARRSAAAQAKASRQHDEYARPYRSFRGLLGHLATL